MSELSTELANRSNGACELCSQSSTAMTTYIVTPKKGDQLDEQIAVCPTCLDQLTDFSNLDDSYWRSVNESIWSPVPSIQVLSYRILQHFHDQSWAQTILGMIYLDEESLEWANYQNNSAQHIDSNGQILHSGDTVVLIKDLDVKGANFSAKRGTSVRKIHLVQDNPDQIEGRINDQQIVILTKFVRKAT